MFYLYVYIVSMQLHHEATLPVSCVVHIQNYKDNTNINKLGITCIQIQFDCFLNFFKIIISVHIYCTSVHSGRGIPPLLLSFNLAFPVSNQAILGSILLFFTLPDQSIIANFPCKSFVNVIYCRGIHRQFPSQS